MTENTVPERSKKSKKPLFVGMGAVAGIAAIGVGSTFAFWADEESAGAGFNTGQFEIEISTDGGDTWQSGTTTDDYAVLDITDIVDDIGEHSFKPDDYTTTYFQIRAAEGQTHNGVLDADNISINYDIPDELDNHFTYYLATAPDQDIEADIDIEGAIGSNGILSESGSAEVLVDGTPIEFAVGLHASEQLPQGLEGEVSWQLVAELAD